MTRINLIKKTMKIPFHIKILLNTLNVKGLDLSSRLKVFLILIRKIFRLVIRKNSSVNVSCIKKELGSR